MERRTALVTGASQGLGAEIAVALARDGCDVAVSSRRMEKLAGTLDRIAAAGARAVPVELDLRSPPSIERAIAQAIIEAAPDRIIWGSDYPHLSFADKVGSVEPFNLLGQWAPDAATRRKILVENPQELFGFQLRAAR